MHANCSVSVDILRYDNSSRLLIKSARSKTCYLIVTMYTVFINPLESIETIQFDSIWKAIPLFVLSFVHPNRHANSISSFFRWETSSQPPLTHELRRNLLSSVDKWLSIKRRRRRKRMLYQSKSKHAKSLDTFEEKKICVLFMRENHKKYERTKCYKSFFDINID